MHTPPPTPSLLTHNKHTSIRTCECPTYYTNKNKRAHL